MKKRIIICSLLCLIIVAVMPAALAVNPTVSIYIDGEPVKLDTPAVILDSTTYIPIRAFSMAMGADEVIWDNDTSVATVHGEGLTITAKVGDKYIVANDRYLYASDGCRIYNNCMMIPVRPIVKAFGAKLNWVGDTRSVYIQSGNTPLYSSAYEDEDVYWLSRIINAEAGGEPFAGKIAVGNVIINRVLSGSYPSTIYDVIFDFSYGVQFTPAYTGDINKEPSQESIIAAKCVLDGAVELEDAYYFSSIEDCWAAENRPYITTIGNHYFYG